MSNPCRGMYRSMCLAGPSRHEGDREFRGGEVRCTRVWRFVCRHPTASPLCLAKPRGQQRVTFQKTCAGQRQAWCACPGDSRGLADRRPQRRHRWGAALGGVRNVRRGGQLPEEEATHRMPKGIKSSPEYRAQACRQVLEVLKCPPRHPRLEREEPLCAVVVIDDDLRDRCSVDPLSSCLPSSYLRNDSRARRIEWS